MGLRPSDERARDEEGERGDGDEVPVDVDQRMQEVGRQNERERELVPAATQAAPEQEEGAQQEQCQADDPGLREELQRQIVRLDREVEIALAEAQVGEVERACTGAGELMAAKAVPRLAPPDEAEVRAGRAEAPATVADGARAGALHHEEEHRRAENDAGGDERPAAQGRRDPPPRQPLERDGRGGAEQQEHTEDQAVPPAHM